MYLCMYMYAYMHMHMYSSAPLGLWDIFNPTGHAADHRIQVRKAFTSRTKHLCTTKCKEQRSAKMCKLQANQLRFPAHSGSSSTLHVIARYGHSRYLITAAEASSIDRHFAPATSRMSHHTRSSVGSPTRRRHFVNHPTYVAT